MSRSQRTTTTAATWRDVRASLDKLDRVGLRGLVRDLYNVDALNRRVLHARFAPNTTTIGQYRRLIVRLLDMLPDADRGTRVARLARLGEYQEAIGWGYGDFLADVATRLHGRVNRSRRRKRSDRGSSRMVPEDCSSEPLRE